MGETKVVAVCGVGYDPTDTFPANEHRAIKGDWVVARAGGQINGLVRRVAKDGSWVDVRWRTAYEEWTKRMRAEALLIICEVPLDDGWWVMDVTRHRKLLDERDERAVSAPPETQED